ncbi:MAG: KEOPS complex subunit Pcc1 [Nitrososphaera sp.]
MRPYREITVSLRIPFSSSSRAKAVLNALIPDNVNFPKGLSMKIHADGVTLVIEVCGKNVPMATIASTIDEVLQHVSVATKVMTE